MDYSKIFNPQTLQKLNKKSSENLKTMLGDKNLIQTIQSSQKLLDEITKVEAPYKNKLEKLAVSMVKELYPIIEEEEIVLDAKLVGMSDVNKSLDEIKINNPILQDEEIINFIISNIILKDKFYYPKYQEILKNYGLTNQGLINFLEKLPLKDKINFYNDTKKYINQLDESISPEGRRRVINAVTQGAALKGAFAFYLFKEHLDELDPSLVEKYNQIMKNSFGIYDDPNAISMMLSLLAQGHKTAGGSSKVIIQEQESSGITIKARAICFPMLVHELIKGLYELISLQGFKGDKAANQDVVNKVDKLEHEPEDIQKGKFIYDALNKIFAESNYNDPRIREFFFIDIYKLDDDDFISLIENAINENLTPSQLKWVDQTLKEIDKDLKADDAEKYIDENMFKV
jgi:hypothetical protein